jgi:hypothetical protein
MFLIWGREKRKNTRSIYIFKKLNARRENVMTGQIMGALLSVGVVTLLGKSIDWLLRNTFSSYVPID